jgi:hypothetical protein
MRDPRQGLKWRQLETRGEDDGSKSVAANSALPPFWNNGAEKSVEGDDGAEQTKNGAD